MTPSVNDPLETILRLCAAAAPQPWYPKQYAAEAGVSRDALDPPLERLRLGGLIQLTEWVEGNGQGYILTPAGRRALQNPRDLERVQSNAALHAPTKPRSREGDATTYERGETIRASLLIPTTPWVTYTLLAANILWYLYAMRLAQAQGMDPGTFLSHGTPLTVLQKTGAIEGSYLASGDKWQWVRLLASCFVHGGLIHLGMNMLGLYWVGPLIERMWGHVRFLVIYLIAGLGGSCVMVVMDPRIPGVGASGAIWGIMTSMAAWIILNRKFMPPSLVSNWLRQLLLLFVLNIGIGFVPGISMSAHLGGGAFGAIAAVLLNVHRFGRGAWRWLALATVVALPLVCLQTVAKAMTIDPRWGPVIDNEERKAINQQLAMAQEATKEAHRAYSDLAKPLQERHSTRRDPEKVQQAITALRAARGKVTDAAATVGAIGLFRSARIEEVRQVRHESLEAWAKLLETMELYLEHGDNQDHALAEQEAKVVESESRFHKLLHSD
jgi:membrane associated rhomboid family serine protease